MQPGAARRGGRAPTVGTSERSADEQSGSSPEPPVPTSVIGREGVDVRGYAGYWGADHTVFGDSWILGIRVRRASTRKGPPTRSRRPLIRRSADNSECGAINPELLPQIVGRREQSGEDAEQPQQDDEAEGHTKQPQHDENHESILLDERCVAFTFLTRHIKQIACHG